MSLFSDLRLRWKLFGAFGAMCVLMVAVGWVGISSTRTVKAALDDTGGLTVPSMLALSQTQTNLLIGQRAISSAILADDPTAIQEYVDAGRRALGDSATAWTTYEALPS